MQSPLASHSTLKGFCAQNTIWRSPCHHRQVAHFLSLSPVRCMVGRCPSLSGRGFVGVSVRGEGGARRTSAFPFETGAGAPFGRFSAVGLLVQIKVDAGATPLARRDSPHHTPPARPRQAKSSAGRRARPRHAPRRIQPKFGSWTSRIAI